MEIHTGEGEREIEARDTWLLPQTSKVDYSRITMGATRVAVEVEDEDCPLRQSAKSDKKQR